MERYIGGTEIQLGVVPLSGKVSEDRTILRKDANRVAERLIAANNKTRLYGIPVANLADDGGVATWLFNGGLIYQDMGHPEYATPECRSLDEIASYEIAGRRIVGNLLRLENFTRPTHAIFANNTDHYGEIFAYHENYIAKGDPNKIANHMLPFLLTRQIFCGAGMVISESMKQHLKLRDIALSSTTWFAISQRSLAARIAAGKLWIGQYSRFAGANRHNDKLLHITCGDTNFTKYTTKLKIGTTALVQQIVEDGFRVNKKLGFMAMASDRFAPNLTEIALNTDFRWIFNSGIYECPAIDVQRLYLEEARRRFIGRDSDTDWTLNAWKVTLDQLEADPLQATWIDWVRKFNFLAPRFSSSKWSQEEVIRMDLSFHAPDPDKSILRLIGGIGLDDTAIIYAMNHPPTDTRAYGRGLAVRALDPVIGSKNKLPTITWDCVELPKVARMNMPDSGQTYLEQAIRFQKQIVVFNS